MGISPMGRASQPASEEPNLPGAAPVDEVRLFNDIVRKHGPWPEGVRRVELRFGEDSTGAPACLAAPFGSFFDLRFQAKSSGESEADQPRLPHVVRWAYPSIRAGDGRDRALNECLWWSK